MAKLNDARRSLERAKESAVRRLEQLEEERKEIKASLKALDAALRALKGSSAKAKRKPVTTAEEFSRIVDQTLHDIGPSSVAELQAAIRQRMNESGESIQGLEARLEAELTDSRFALEQDRVRSRASG